MNKKFLINAIAILLTITLAVPAVFLIAPQRTVAQTSGGGCVVGLAAGLASVVTNQVKSVPSGDMPSGVAGWTSAGSNVGSCLYNLIVVPALRQMIRGFLQTMTQSTISWINGNNSTGQPSFVLNLGMHLQSVGNAVAIPFINQITAGFNSPFGPAIASSLMKSYSQQTSTAGFFAANQSTLPGSLQSQKAFVAGNWSQGGIAEWFALTTQDNNNPYMLYQSAQGQLGSNVGQAQTNRRQDLISGQGFLSYCGGDTSTKVNVNLSAGGINPQVSCFNPDGTSANVTTPGSTISSYLQANVNSGISQLVSAQDLDAAILQIVMALGNQVLGSAGLFGSSQPSSSSNTTPVSTMPSSSATSAISFADSKLAGITAYTSAWATIATAANIASTTAAGLASFCIAGANEGAGSGGTQSFVDAANAQFIAAQTAIRTLIDPVLVQAQSAPSMGIETTALALKIKAAAILVPLADPTQFGIDVATLATMSPATTDVVLAQQDAQVSGGARANQVCGEMAYSFSSSCTKYIGGLMVSGGSLVDQMNLITTNAAALKTTVCNPNSSLYTVYNYNTGG
ncbi:MAG: hypothetical protein NUV90_03200 [Candidatus Parcubacteria bacterium]|nr:hypothetical protein [Candidatus Parcubacteria bacterium]